MQKQVGTVENRFEFKCAVCAVCDGRGCIGQVPGMGGVNNNKNFKLNFEGWKTLWQQAASAGTLDAILSTPIDARAVRVGPVTGAVQNIGFEKEEYFYLPYFSAARNAGIGLCVGDGYPDYKLHYGLDAVRKLQKVEPELKAAVFLKPYPNEKLFERIAAAEGVAEIIGNDIDSYNIATMRDLVHLEKKTPEQIAEIRKRVGVPYAIKGIFCKEDVELVKAVKPDIAFVSNHGGRIDTREGSTAEFLAAYGAELKKYCGSLWVDGGVRTRHDIQTALFYGAAQVIIARPFIAALVSDGIGGMVKKIDEIITGEIID
ncbi:alpha-hydroxy-acid oxidizing protein [Treponema sp. SP13]